MKTTIRILFAAALPLSSVPAHATKNFGTYCGKNPTVSIVTAADEVLGK